MEGTRKLLLTVVALLLVAPMLPTQSASADTPVLIITEVKVRNDTAGFDEFIELYNAGTEPVALNEYVIGYINTPNPSADQLFASSVVGDGLLAAGQSLVLAKNELDPNLPNAKKSPFSSLSDSGGTLRLTDSGDAVIDQFSWTSTQSASTGSIQFLCTSSTTFCNLNKSQSFGRGQDTDGNYLLTSPTWQLGVPTPQSAVLLPFPDPEPDPEPEPENPPEEEPIPTEEQTETPDPAPSSPALLQPQITELLPNPAAPASDSTDEYIELYNPNAQEVNLAGYKLQSGSTFSYSYTFSAATLGANAYKAFFVSETGAILSNTTGQARLLNPAGEVVAQTNVYDSAEEGEAWALINDVWQWTTTPSPHAANILTASPLKLATTTKASTKKAPVAKTAAKKKTAAAKTAKPAAAAAQRQVYEDPAETIAALHPGILAGVGLLTLVYAAYEYRYDVINRLQQFRRYREIRRTARS